MNALITKGQLLDKIRQSWAELDRALLKLDEAQQVFQSLLQLIESLAEGDLHDPTHFPGMPLVWQPWDLLAGNTYEHYAAHLPRIRVMIK